MDLFYPWIVHVIGLSCSIPVFSCLSLSPQKPDCVHRSLVRSIRAALSSTWQATVWEEENPHAQEDTEPCLRPDVSFDIPLYYSYHRTSMDLLVVYWSSLCNCVCVCCQIWVQCVDRGATQEDSGRGGKERRKYLLQTQRAAGKGETGPVLLQPHCVYTCIPCPLLDDITVTTHYCWFTGKLCNHSF